MYMYVTNFVFIYEVNTLLKDIILKVLKNFTLGI